MYMLPQKWLGVKLDSPACGEQNLQLIFNDADQSRQVKSLLGCEVTVTGELYKGNTREYWTKLAMDDAEVKPDALCKPAPVESDPMKVPIPEALKSYTVTMRANTVYDSDWVVSSWMKNEQGAVVMLEPTVKYLDYGIMVLADDRLVVRCAEGFVAKGFMENGKTFEPLPKEKRMVPNGMIPGGQELVLKQNVKEVVEFTCERKGFEGTKPN
jgi:Domain of unknown function (DUF4431)